ncbi:MAG: MurR/RpiR family transcriptional regulator [Paracoccaceae bacterium]
MREKSFLNRVRDTLDVLHPTERRLAVFLLNFPGELAAYTAQELAALAAVSAPTVSRFVKRLGYVNYEEARRHVRADRKEGAALLMVTARTAEPDNQLRAHLDQAKANLDATMRTLPASEVDAIARALLDAPRSWVLGFRTSQSFATYFHWQSLQVLPGLSVIPQAGQTMGEHLATIRPDDCVVVFALARRIRGMEAILSGLIQTGAKVALISDDAMARRSDVAWHLQCATLAPGPLFSHVSVMLLTQVLATRLVELSGPQGRKRLSAIEAWHDRLDEL